METNFKYLDNGLKVSVDWISFTVTEIDSVDRVLSLFGYSSNDFTELPHGAHGYNSMLRLNGHSISVLYDGKEGMGIHVDVTGSSVLEFIRSFKETLKEDTPFGPGYEIDFDSSFMQALFSVILRVGHFTRIDLAIDDIGTSFFSTDDLCGLWANHCIVTKDRNMKNVVESISGNVKIGHTVYFGSRKSDIFLRVYDKRLEQNRKLERARKPMISTPWTRWELECKDSRADAVARKLVDCIAFGEVVVGVLSHYFRVVQLDDSNRSRCTIDERWAAFINGVSPLKLYIPKEEKTLDDKKAWLEYQCGPTIAAVVISDFGSYGFLEKCVHSGALRLTKGLSRLIAPCLDNPGFYGGGSYGDPCGCPS